MYIRRDLEKRIEAFMGEPEIIAVTGPRQCGKTTLVKHLLSKKKNVNQISFDNQKILELFEEDIDSFIDIHVKGYAILFIDEVQYARDSGKKLKYIYDNHHTKIIISGSSVSELSISSLKFLVGRIIIFNLYPFSFAEFLRAKDPRVSEIFEKGRPALPLNTYLEEFIIYGGYPRVVLAKTNDMKKVILENIYSTYLLKEIREIMELSHERELVKLLKALSLQTGNMVVFDTLSQATGFNYQQLQKYLGILEKTFVCKHIQPFYTNKMTELVKTQKIFFFDTGFRNIILGTSELSGNLYENLIFSELVKKNRGVKYWRTKAKAEVDFIVDDKIPIELKSKITRESITKSFRSFIEKYQPSEGYVLSTDYESTTQIKETKVQFLSYPSFLSKLVEYNQS
ncbi:MAG: ATP-binding protein [Nanobdellota archaeon]